MPLLYDEPEPDLVGLGEGLATMRLSSGLAWNTIFKDSQLTGRFIDAVKVQWDREARPLFRQEPLFGNVDGSGAGKLSAEEATDQFGIDGVLKFSEPVRPVEAAWKQREAQDRDFRDYVLSNSDIGPLSAMGAALAGTMLDPVSWPLMFAPEFLGLGKLTQAAMGVRAGSAALKVGRLANAGRFLVEGAVEGVVGGAIYEAGLNYPLRNAEGEDYRWQDASRNVLIGGIFGAGIGGAKGLLHAMLPGKAGGAGHAVDPEAAGLADDIENFTETTLPDAVERLPEEQRGAAAALAIDRIADDAPVDMGPVFETQAKATLAALDEVPGQPGALKARYLAEDVAVSTRGTEIPVRYALAELRDLITSHDDDLVRNGDYPGVLQPRDRGERAGSIAANRGLQGRLHPKLLLESPSAETGSPIVSRDGVVESGNGRLIAMRRDAAESGKFWARYQEALAGAGHDTAGMDQPVLVRVRDSVLNGQQRAELARELNPSITEQMGPREQAMADAASMPADVLEKLAAGPVDGAANGPFARAFLDRLAPDQLNSLTDSAGRLSKDGAERLRAAVMAMAYGDGDLLETVFEQTANSPGGGPLKSIGLALADAAPAWTRMRADMARGLTPPEVDITGNIKAAVGLIRHAREQRMALPKLLTERQAQTEAFGSGLSPETETLLRLFYDNKAMTSPRDPALVAEFLNQYARQAQAKTPGPDLFGETHDGAARQILENLGQQLARQDGTFGDVLARLRVEQARPDGGAVAAGDAGAVLFDTGGQGGVGGRRGPGAGPEGAGGADSPVVPSRPAEADTAQGGKDGEPAATPVNYGQAFIAADPELKALFDDTQAMLAREGLDGAPVAPKRDPDTIATAMRTAALCLLEAAGDL